METRFLIILSSIFSHFLSFILPHLSHVAVSGIIRWKNRLWSLVSRFIELRNKKDEGKKLTDKKMADYETKLKKLRKTAIQDVSVLFIFISFQKHLFHINKHFRSQNNCCMETTKWRHYTRSRSL